MKNLLTTIIFFVLFIQISVGQHAVLEPQIPYQLASQAFLRNLTVVPQENKLIYQAYWNNFGGGQGSGMRYGLLNDSIQQIWTTQNYGSGQFYVSRDLLRSTDGNSIFLRNKNGSSTNWSTAIRKIDDLETEIWSRYFDGQAISIDETNDLDFVLCGSLGTGTMPSDTGYVWKITETGGSYWSHSVDYFPKRILSSSTGDIFVTGVVEDTPSNNSDLLVAKYDEDFNLLWENHFGSLGRYEIEEIIETSDNNFVIIGTRFSTVVTGFIYTPFFLKIDADGNELASIIDADSTSLLGIDASFATIIELNDGRFIAGGYTKPNPATVDYYNSDALVAQISADGIVDWVETFGGSKKDGIYDLVYENGEITFGGISNSIDGDLENVINDYSVLYEYVWSGKLILTEGLFKVNFDIFYDANQNQIFDSTEYFLPGARLDVLPSGIAAFSKSNTTSFTYLEEGEYQLEFNTSNNPGWSLTTDSSLYHLTIDSNYVVDTFQFGVFPINQTSEMHSSLTGPSARCGEFITFETYAKNIGTTITDGTIWMEIDSNINSINFIDLPDTTIGTNLVGWYFENLFLGHGISKKINLQIPAPPNFTLGDSLYFNTYIEFSDINGIATSNVFDYRTEVRCSFDPNDKLVNPSRNNNLTLFEEDLVYTIRFQNTGNDAAYDIVIRDTLDGNLNPTSFKVLSTSHPISLLTSMEDDQYLTFNFENIYLPDSTADFDGSQGYVSYKISPKMGLMEETVIENTASIYFDFNPPIVTNTTENVMVSELPTSVHYIGGQKDMKIEIFPNPIFDHLFIKKEKPDLLEYQIIDVNGRLVLTGILQDEIQTIAFLKMNPGVYFVKVINPKTQEFIVEKIIN